MAKRSRYSALADALGPKRARIPTLAADLRCASVNVEDMCVHQVLDGPEEEELIVSTQKRFRLVVSLRGAKGARLGKLWAGGSRRLKAVLLYENGHLVEEGPLGEAAMIGGEVEVDESGQAVFNLQIGPTSSQRQNQRFRVRVSVRDAPEVSPAITKPVRTKTKIRLPKDKHVTFAAAAPPCAAAIEQPLIEAQAVAVAAEEAWPSIEAFLHMQPPPAEEQEKREEQAGLDVSVGLERRRQDHEILTANTEAIRKLKEQEEEIRRELTAARRAISGTPFSFEAEAPGALRLVGA